MLTRRPVRHVDVIRLAASKVMISACDRLPDMPSSGMRAARASETAILMTCETIMAIFKQQSEMSKGGAFS